MLLFIPWDQYYFKAHFSDTANNLNRSFPGYSVPLFRNESSYKTFHENEFDLHENEPVGEHVFI